MIATAKIAFHVADKLITGAVEELYLFDEVNDDATTVPGVNTICIELCTIKNS